MKAKIKNKYGLVPKGSVFTVFDISKKTVCLIIDNRKVDFGFSEITFLINTDKDSFELGRFLLNAFSKNGDFAMKQKDIDEIVQRIPYTKTVSRKAISDFIFDF